MSNNERCLEINKNMTDSASKMRALYNLVNVSLLDAETDRTELSSNYEKMIDYKNDVNSILTGISTVKKAERTQLITKSKPRLKSIHKEAKQTNENFEKLRNKFNVVLKESLPLKTQYLKEVKDMCNEFNAILKSCEIDSVYKKGFSQQLKMIKLINSKIDELVMDYNIKRNQLDSDNQKFNALFSSVNDIISQLEVSA